MFTGARGGLLGQNPGRVVAQPPDLINWVRREGGFVNQSVKIANVDPHRNELGLVASDDIPIGSELIILPPYLPLRFKSEDEGFLVSTNLSRHIPEEFWAMKLGLKVLHERGKRDSFWWPYIANLPQTYNLPIFFPVENIKDLQYAPLLSQVQRRRLFLVEFEKMVKSELENLKLDHNHHPFGEDDMDSSSLTWAMSSVSSRAFHLYLNGTGGPSPMLLPLVDMCNHSFIPNIEVIQTNESETKNALIKVIACVHIKQDDQLLVNYNVLNNDLFLLNFGFVVPGNPFDFIVLKLDSSLLYAASMAAGVQAPDFSSPLSWQLQILDKLNLVEGSSNTEVRIGGAEIVEGRLLAALRVLLTTEKERAQSLSLDTLKSLSSSPPPLGVSIELAALRIIIALCGIALEYFPTRITEDESILKQSVSSFTKLAVQYRIQKKSAIIHAMKDLTRRVKLLSSVASSAGGGRH